jgi:hypothetical protein
MSCCGTIVSNLDKFKQLYDGSSKKIFVQEPSFAIETFVVPHETISRTKYNGVVWTRHEDGINEIRKKI